MNTTSPRRPLAFPLLTKPRGAICNLARQYCYFLSKEHLYPDSDFRMSDDLLEEYTRQYIEAQEVSESPSFSNRFSAYDTRSPRQASASPSEARHGTNI